MQERRGKSKVDKTLTSGPGNISKALGISKTYNSLSVTSENIWIEDIGHNPSNIKETTRIGIDYAGEDAALPWRFYDKDSKFVSVK